MLGTAGGFTELWVHVGGLWGSIAYDSILNGFGRALNLRNLQ